MDIPQELFEIYYEVCDDFIDLNFGVNTILFYGPKRSICPNCNYNPVTKMSSNTYKSGGPIVFADSICPYCDGNGFTESEETETIKLRVYFTPKHWVKLPIPLNINDSAIQIIGHIVDMPKIRNAKKIRVCAEQEGYMNYDYILAGEPLPHGFKRNKYFIAMLIRE